MNQAEQQVQLVRAEATRLAGEAARAKELETENKFAEKSRGTELRVQTMEEYFQLRVNSVHEQINTDYALEL